MTIIDALLQLDPNPTAITVTAASTNTLDLLNQRDMGIGDMTGGTPKVIVQIVTTFAGGTSIQAAFQTAPDNGSGAPGTWTNAILSDVVLTADLVAGNRLLEVDWPRPRPNAVVPRFVRLNYTVVGTYTSGQVTSAIVLTDQAAPRKAGFMGAYPAGVTVAN